MDTGEAYDCRFGAGFGPAAIAVMACDGLPATLLIDCFMRYRTLPRLAAIAAVCLSPLAASLPLLAAEPKINNFAVADAVTSVQLCGNRNSGSNKSAQPYRVVLGEQNGQSVLFVQWMNQPEGAGSWRGVAAHTQGFAEINDDKAGLTLQNLRCTAQGKGIRITANVVGGPKTTKRRQMRLDVGPALEKYEITFTPALK